VLDLLHDAQAEAEQFCRRCSGRRCDGVLQASSRRGQRRAPGLAKAESPRRPTSCSAEPAAVAGAVYAAFAREPELQLWPTRPPSDTRSHFRSQYTAVSVAVRAPAAAGHPWAAMAATVRCRQVVGAGRPLTADLAPARFHIALTPHLPLFYSPLCISCPLERHAARSPRKGNSCRTRRSLATWPLWMRYWPPASPSTRETMYVC
jgi:hypothetical protein